MTPTHRAGPPRGVGAVRVLVRAHLRRDRWLLLGWCLGGTLLYYSQAAGIDSVYATQAELDRAAASMADSAAMIAMAGPARALDTVGGQVTWQASAFGAVVVGLMSMLLVVRHTRAEEDSGRDELVRSLVVPRRAPLVAALVVAVLGSVAMGLLVTLSLATYPLALADSLALGVGLALCGTLFGAVTLLAVQLVSTSRAAYGLVGAVIGASYALRAVGDVTGGALSWVSPIGWYQAMHPFSGLRWWPALLLLAATALVVRAALGLLARRDLGSGLWASRPGPATAGPGLRGVVGLTWRLQRASVLGWSVGLLLVGLAYGSIGDSAGDLVGDSGTARAMVAGSADDLVAGFFAVAGVLLALLAAGFAISAVLRLPAEEDDGRAELLLASPVGRPRWLGAHLLVAAVGTTVVVIAGAVGLGLGYLLVTGDARDAVRYGMGCLPLLAPVLALGSAAAALHGLVRRAAPLAWLLLVGSVLVAFFADLWSLPTWVRGLSPFWHLAAWPAEPFELTPVLLVAAVAAAFAVLARLALVRRDIG